MMFQEAEDRKHNARQRMNDEVTKVILVVF